MTFEPQPNVNTSVNLPMPLRMSQIPGMFSPGAEPEPPLTPAQRRARREALFAENISSRLGRLLRSVLPRLKEGRIAQVLPIIDFLGREKYIGSAGLPDPLHGMVDAHGLAGLADDLSPGTIMEACSRGLTLGGSFGPVTWRAPAERRVASPKAMMKALGEPAGPYRFAFDSTFEEVVARCTRFGKPMSPRLMMAYCGLYDADLAHSFEVRNENGELVAAGFGIALGKMFLLENLCARDEAALCFGLLHLARYLDAWDFTTIEGKALDPEFNAPDLGDIGFTSLSRLDYNRSLRSNLGADVGPYRWRADVEALERILTIKRQTEELRNAA